MSRVRVLAALALLCLVAALFQFRAGFAGRFAANAPGNASHGRAPSRATSAPDLSVDPSAAEPAAAELARAARAETRVYLAYAGRWDEPAPAGFAAFREWTARYLATPAAARPALEAEGVALAAARRERMRELIITDPRRALAITVPMGIRQQLPAGVVGQLETRVTGNGEFALVASVDAANRSGVRRIAVLDGMTFTAHVYGRREPQSNLAGAPLHGIAIDRDLALHESPVRAVESGEGTAAASNESCPVTDVATTAADDLSRAEVAGRIVEFCAGDADMLGTFARQLEANEATLVARTPGIPPTAAEAATAWTTGVKQVLVIRVDFSDIPGEPIGQGTALATLNTSVRQLYEEMSYGQTSIEATVSDLVYRMPSTGSSYAINDNEGQLHTDARNAAGANYTMSNYDRIIVVFPNIGTSRFSASKVTFAGEANVNGANVWINGGASFTLGTLTHELGHTYGLLHANLWRVKDGNPISPTGTTLEYGDPFDMMGSTSATGVARDARHHFNAWHKNRLGWLPDSGVTTVTKSGTYRVYRFDGKDTPLNQAQALRIFRDGVRWYWVGLRQNFASGSPQSNGAYVIWGFNNRQQSEMLDLTTPGTNANDAALGLGQTFTDAANGVTIRPIARGGTDPLQYLDVEVTLTTPPDVVASWGREGAYFFSANTGDPVTPLPETFVPFDLRDVRAIAAGDKHAVALRANGGVTGWGENSAGQIDVPANLGDVVSVAAGADVSGVIRRDGTVQLWGQSSSGQTTPPAGLTGVTSLRIGRNHVLALKSDGTVIAWGSNSLGQSTVPAGLADVVAIAAGTELSVALKRDGTVTSWGSSFGRPPAGTTGIAAIAACGTSLGGQFVVALKTDGTVTAWGANNLNQSSVPAGVSGVVSVAAGAFHGVALKADGTVVGWGSGAAAVPPRGLPWVRSIAASSSTTFALMGPSIQISTQTADQTIIAGTRSTLSVAATGAGPLTYQWRKDGVAVAGATTSALNLGTTTAGSAGMYDLVMNDGVMTVNSTPIWLAIAGAGPEVSRIANLSIRTNAGTGAQTLTVGFVVGGGGTFGAKPLLVRGVGPTLSRFGVPNAAQDPQVQLYGSNAALLVQNDNWLLGDAPIFTSVGAFALGASSRDAALYRPATALGGYSAQISGVNNTSGIVLAEIYDATTPGSFTATVPRLINVSARAQSGTGIDALVAGFVISGPTSKTVLIRAIGPTLAPFGVTGVLTNPKLELFNASGTSIRQNDDWGGTAELTAAFRSVGAFALPTDSRDAAILATLAPGNYTAQVSGVGGTTGVALIEVYEVP